MATTFKQPPTNYPAGRAVLASGIDSDDTALTLVSGGAAALNTSASYWADLFDEASPEAIEIVLVTNVVGEVLTVTRGEQGTTAQAWDAGTIVEMRLTKQAVADIHTAIAGLESRVVDAGAAVNTSALDVGGGYAGGSGMTASTTGDVSMSGAFQCDGAARVNGLLRPWTMWVPASQFVSASGSPSQATWTGGSSAKQTAWFLDGATTEDLATTIMLPIGYAGQSIRIEILWTGDSAGSGVVRWITRGNVSADGAALALAFNTDVEDTYQGADVTHYVSVDATEGTGRAMCIGIGRRGDHVNDTLTQDAAFLGVFVSIL